MEEPTQNPLSGDKPAVGRVRAAVQLSCGCDAYVDVPLIIFGEVGQELEATDAARYIFGNYCASLFQELALVDHRPDFCPATFGSEITEEKA